MKTNIKFILTMLTISAIAIAVTAKIDLSYVPVALSYVTAGVVLAMAAMDNRAGSKNYAAR